MGLMEKIAVFSTSFYHSPYSIFGNRVALLFGFLYLRSVEGKRLGVHDDTTNNSNLVTPLARTVVGYCLSKVSSFFLRQSPLKRHKTARWPSKSS